MKCPYCSSENIIKGVLSSQSAESGLVGLRYRKGIFIGTEPLLYDICCECGTIARTYVNSADRNWVCSKKQ